MIRKNVLNIVGGYDQAFISIEDYEMWWRVLKVSKVKNLEEELVTRTHRTNSTFRNSKRHSLQKDVKDIMDCIPTRNFTTHTDGGFFV